MNILIGATCVRGAPPRVLECIGKAKCDHRYAYVSYRVKSIMKRASECFDAANFARKIGPNSTKNAAPHRLGTQRRAPLYDGIRTLYRHIRVCDVRSNQDDSNILEACVLLGETCAPLHSL